VSGIRRVATALQSKEYQNHWRLHIKTCTCLQTLNTSRHLLFLVQRKPYPILGHRLKSDYQQRVTQRNATQRKLFYVDDKLCLKIPQRNATQQTVPQRNADISCYHQENSATQAAITEQIPIETLIGVDVSNVWWKHIWRPLHDKLVNIVKKLQSSTTDNEWSIQFPVIEVHMVGLS